MARFKGTRNDDTLIGTDGRDCMRGGRGDDELYGGGGSDWLFGGRDDDILAGGDGNDALFGGRGGDELFGGDGHDWLKGGRGDDWLEGGNGNDWLFGGSGNDGLNGGAGCDRLFGGSGCDDLNGGAGNDLLVGGRGHDALDGGAGSDWLFGGSGHDEITYVAAENAGDRDYADGGRGHDDLILQLTGAEWADATLQGDLGEHLDFIASRIGWRGEAHWGSFQYDAFDLKVGRVENLRVVVDGTELSAADDAVDAQDDSFAGDEDSTISGNVLDDNGAGADSVPDLLGTVSLVSGPGEGVLTLNADGSFDYVPDAQDLAVGESRTVSFVYEVTDVDGDSDRATASITIHGVNDDPEARDDDFSTDQNTILSGNLLANDSDPDGDALTVVAVSGGWLPGDILLSLGGREAVVTLSADGLGGLSVDPSGNFDDLGQGESDSLSFEYTVSDGNGGLSTATATIEILGVNDDPLAQDDAAETDGTDPVNIAVLANDSDVDGDSLIVTTAIAANGTVTVETDGSLTYVADDGFDGVDTVTYTIVDGNGGEDTAQVAVTVNAVATDLFTPGNDNVSGTAGADNYDGLAGDDTIFGLAGDDTLFGSGGADSLVGGAGIDELYGGEGKDTLSEGELMDGGAGADVLINGSAGNLLYGNLGRDTLTNEQFGDTTSEFYGGGGNDLLDARPGGVPGSFFGNGGIDLYGGDGKDVLFGYAASNTPPGANTGTPRAELSGGGGADTITGTSAEDIFDGGIGNDVIDASIGVSGGFDPTYIGDGRVDTFVYRPGDGADTILGLETDVTTGFFGPEINDKIDISAFGFTDFATDVAGLITGGGFGGNTNYTVDFGNGDVLTITTVQPSGFGGGGSLDEENFIL